jgi:hypothetical protein
MPDAAMYPPSRQEIAADERSALDEFRDLDARDLADTMTSDDLRRAYRDPEATSEDRCAIESVWARWAREKFGA